MRSPYVAATVLALLMLAPRVASASCVYMPDSCKYLLEADAVFEATVVSVQVRQLPNGYLERAYSLADVRALKGRADTIVRSGRDWGHGLEVGARYIVDAVRDPVDGGLRVRQCSMMEPLEQAGGLLDFVRSLSLPSTGGYLWGRVVGREGDGPASEPVKGATVSIDGPVQYTFVTPADGTYSVSALPEGEYTVSVTLPWNRQDLKAVKPETVRLGGPRACADVSFVAYGLMKPGNP